MAQEISFRGTLIEFKYEPTSAELYQACLYSFTLAMAISKIVYRKPLSPEICWDIIYRDYHRRYRPNETWEYFLDEMAFVETTLEITDKLKTTKEEIESKIRGIVDHFQKLKNRQALKSLFSLN